MKWKALFQTAVTQVTSTLHWEGRAAHKAMAGSHERRLLAIQSLTQARLYNSITPASHSITSTVTGWAGTCSWVTWNNCGQTAGSSWMHLFHFWTVPSESPFDEEHGMEHSYLRGTNARSLNIRLEVFQHQVIGHRTFLLKPWLYYFIFIPFLQKAREKVVQIWNLRHNSRGWWIRPDNLAGLIGSWKYPLKATWAHLIWQ